MKSGNVSGKLFLTIILAALGGALAIGAQAIAQDDRPAADVEAKTDETAKAAPTAGDEDLSVQVYKIFMRSCIGCHGSHMKKPEGKFVMDDLKALAADEDYITAGSDDPIDSYCYETVVMDPEDPEFMPPPDDKEYPPLTEAEKKIFLQWIVEGAEVSDAVAQVPNPYLDKGTDPGPDNGEEPKNGGETDNGNGEAAGPDQTSPAAEESMGKRWRDFFGQFHAASTHMPVGLLVAAFLAEFLSLFGGSEKLRYVARFCLLFGTLGAVYSLLSGWWIGGTYSYDRLFKHYPGFLFFAQERGMDVYWHRWLGVLSVVLAVPCTLFAYVAERSRQKEDGGKGMVYVYRTFLLLTVITISIVGLLGGNIVNPGDAKVGHKWHYHMP